MMIEIKNNENDIYENYKELQKEFNILSDNISIGTTKIKNIIKKIEKQLNKNELIEKKNKNKNKKQIKDKKDCGFAESKSVPESLELFFNIEHGSMMSRTKIGGLFQEYIKKNNLKGNSNINNKIDNRIYRMDDKLAKLFDVSNEDIVIINSANSSNIKYPLGLNFFNYQKWIKKLYENK